MVLMAKYWFQKLSLGDWLILFGLALLVAKLMGWIS